MCHLLVQRACERTLLSKSPNKQNADFLHMHPTQAVFEQRTMADSRLLCVFTAGAIDVRGRMTVSALRLSGASPKSRSGDASHGRFSRFHKLLLASRKSLQGFARTPCADGGDVVGRCSQTVVNGPEARYFRLPCHHHANEQGSRSD